MHYLSYDLVVSYVPRLTSRARSTSQMAILVKRCCINRDSAPSSSRRLPRSFGGLWGFLRTAFCLPGLLLGRPQKAPKPSKSTPKRCWPLGRLPLGLSLASCFRFLLPKMVLGAFWDPLGLLLGAPGRLLEPFGGPCGAIWNSKTGPTS